MAKHRPRTRKAKAAPPDGEVLFREFAENVPEIVWIREAGSEQILYVNPAWKVITDHSPPRSRDDFLQLVHPDDLERVTSEARAAIFGGVNHRYRIVRPDGSQRWLHMRTFAVRDALGRIYRVAGIGKDVTDEVFKDQKLRQFRAAVDASADLVLLIDPKRMRYVDINDTASRTLGYSREELLAMGPSAIFSAPGDELARSYERLMVGDQAPARVEGVYRRKDGTTFPVESFRRVVASVEGDIIVATARDISARRQTEAQLAYLAQFDSLTDLPNRLLFRDRLAQTIAQAQRTRHPAAVLLIDLDRFKLVNDTQGHAVGDELLKETALRLSQCVRNGDTVGRFGGDEFGVVLSGLGKPGDASRVAQKMLDALARPVVLNGHETYITASVGITLYPGDGTEPDSLLANADVAMYRAKELGRNQCQYFTQEMNERAQQWMVMGTALRRALECEEFRLYYQPKVDLATGKVCGFEALLRWQHPGRGLVYPLEFIPLLEDTGLIVPVGEWVLQSACAQVKAWRDAGLPALPVAVNLSARQFQQKDLESSVRRILREVGVDPSLIQFELTESLLMRDPEGAARTLLSLKELGVRLSVDDFGTGYSSLAYLKRFPLNELKIDRVFVRDIATNPDDAAITLAIISLAHSLGLEVVAEGVETEAQLNLLRLHGCDEMQGFYFARPQTATDCTATLIEGRRLKEPAANEKQSAPEVLLVDDAENDLFLLRKALEPAGYRVHTARSPKLGLEVLAKRPIDIVISDHAMPGMTGVEFLAGVRTLYPAAIRIMISGSSNPASMADAINAAGVHKFISKDWDTRRLLVEIRAAYLQHRKARAS